MQKNIEQHTAGPANLEKAIKKHFEQASLPDFGDYLFVRITDRLNYERQLKTLKPKLWAAVGAFLCGLGLLIFSFEISLHAFFQTPTSHYFSLMFTDFSVILNNWQDYSLSIIESLPLGSLALLLSSVLASIVLVDFSAHQFLNFRRTLNSVHYGPDNKVV
jgi:hypothetical protein